MHDGLVPFKLEPYNIGTTLNRWAKEFGLTTMSGTINMANIARDDEIIHAFQRDNTKPNIITCGGCKMRGHHLEDCDVFINHVIAADFARKKPELVSNVRKKVQQFHRRHIMQRCTNFRPNFRPPMNNMAHALQDDTENPKDNADDVPHLEQDESQDIPADPMPPKENQDLDLKDLVHAITGQSDFRAGQGASQL